MMLLSRQDPEALSPFADSCAYWHQAKYVRQPILVLVLAIESALLCSAEALNLAYTAL